MSIQFKNRKLRKPQILSDLKPIEDSPLISMNNYEDYDLIS